jgi:hypothetical protein
MFPVMVFMPVCCEECDVLALSLEEKEMAGDRHDSTLKKNFIFIRIFLT